MEELELYELLLYISWVFYLVSIISLIINLKRLPSFIGGVLLVFLSLGLLTDLIGDYLSSYGIYGYPVIYAYNTLSSTLLFILFRSQFRVKWIRSSLLLIAVGYLLISVVVFIIKGDINYHSPVQYTFTIITTIIIVLLYLYQEFKSAEIPNLTRHFFFWVCTALFIYYGAALFLMLLEDTIRSDIDLFLSLWPIQNVATILFHVLILIGIWRTRATSY